MENNANSTPLQSAQFSSSINWHIEELIKKAFTRMKIRFLSYFLTIVLGFAIWFVTILFAATAFGFLFFLYSLTKSVILVILLGALAFFILIIWSIYISSWIQLSLVSVLIQEPVMGVTATFKKLKPLVWSYFWFTSMYSLFIFGLFLWGILSFTVILILWSFWNSFSIFVFLEKTKKGLENLWYSRAFINQKFWGIAGRMVLIGIAIFFINMILMSSKNSLLTLSSVLISLFTTPFVISFNYEMYKNLEEPKEVKRPMGWIMFSVIGGILLVILLTLGIPFIITTFSTMNFPNVPIKDLPNMPIIIPTFEQSRDSYRFWHP